MNNTDRLIEILSDNNIACNQKQAEQLFKFYEMLIEKNKVMNLTAITEFEEVAVKHFADSLSINKVADISGKSVIDVGTGAGFPGIPLKIMYPDIKLTLLDSLNKRILFLNDVVTELGLEDVETVHARAEEAGRGKYREQFDIVVSRAVANLSTLVEYCLPFAKKNGCFISYKGSKAAEEIVTAGKAIKVLGGGNLKSCYFVLSGSDFERSLIRIEKIVTTPTKYPREGGKPSSSPIS